MFVSHLWWYLNTLFLVYFFDQEPGSLLYWLLLLQISDFIGKSCCNRVLPQFSECKRAWTDQHVYRRIREKCPRHFSEGKRYSYVIRMPCFALTCFGWPHNSVTLCILCRQGQHVHVLSSLMNLILLLQPEVPLGILGVLWTE